MMERADFMRLADAALRRFSYRPDVALTYSLLTTSGTTSSGVLTRISSRYRKGTPTHFPDWPKGTERALLAFGPQCVRLMQLLSLREKGSDGSKGIALDERDINSPTAELIDDIAPDRLVGVPAFAMRVVENLGAASKRTITSVRVAGDRFSDSQREALLSRLPNASDFNVTYTSVETGIISKPACGYLPLNHYHPREELVVEIADPDDTGTGDILISVPQDEIIPVTQYRIGDMGRIRTAPCSCGETTVLEVIGRKGFDYVKVGGAVLIQEEVERVIRSLRAFDDYRIEVAERIEDGMQKGAIVIHAYRRGGKGTDEFEAELKSRFSAQLFLTPTRTLADLTKEGLFAPLEIQYRESPFPPLQKDVRFVRVNN